MKMYVGLGDNSDSHLCLWWKRNKSLKYAFWGAILPSTLLFFLVGVILRNTIPDVETTDEEKLIRQTVACSRIMLPGLAFKILA